MISRNEIHLLSRKWRTEHIETEVLLQYVTDDEQILKVSKKGIYMIDRPLSELQAGKYVVEPMSFWKLYKLLSRRQDDDRDRLSESLNKSRRLRRII